MSSTSSRLLSVFFSAVRGPRREIRQSIKKSNDDCNGRARRDYDKARSLILLSVCIGQTIVGLDQRAITVALPTLTTTFHTPRLRPFNGPILVYDLVLIGLIITMGRLGDLFGRRRFYSVGFLHFRDRLGFLRLVANAPAS